MSSNSHSQPAEDYARVAQAIRYLEQNFRRQPTLKEIAESVNLSEYHFQRLFSRWAGISPKRFLQFLTVEYAKELLAGENNLLEVTYEAGLSSPGRLHDLFVVCEAMTPGEYKQRAAGLTITYGFHPSPFGECLLAMTERGICGLQFVPAGERQSALARLERRWPRATFVADPAQTRPLAEQIFSPVRNGQALPLVLKGTNFQLKVWRALLNIPAGRLVSYEAVAQAIGQPTAARAVGQAVSNNPIGFVIPCHRVIRKVGAVGDYAWGPTRKKAIIGWEASQRERQPALYEW